MLRSRSYLRPLLSVNQRIKLAKVSSSSIRLASKLSYNELLHNDQLVSKISFSPKIHNQDTLENPFKSFDEFFSEQLVLKEDDKSGSNEDNGKQPDNEQIKEEKPERKRKQKKETPSKNDNSSDSLSGTSSSQTSGAGASAVSGGGSSDGGDDGNNRSLNGKIHRSPEIYPQVLAIPITGRPLFPGFYKTVKITNQQVIKAVKRIASESKPYIGVFAFKEDVDSDLILGKDQIFDTGVFAQITSMHENAESLIIVVYPHHRVKVEEVIPPVSLGEEITDDQTFSRSKRAAETELVNEGKDLEDPEVEAEAEQRSIEKATAEIENNPNHFLSEYEVSRVNITLINSEPFDKKSPIINALTSEILRVFKDAAQYNSTIKEQLTVFSDTDNGSVFDRAPQLADLTAALSVGEVGELQAVLEETNIEERLKKSLTLLKREVLQVQLHDKVMKEIDSKITRRQQEYFLTEKLKQLKKELGMDDGRQKIVETVKERMKDLVIPENVQRIVDEEINKLQTLEPHMSEFSVTRNYLDLISNIPFGKYTPETFNIARAQTVLEEDHYGLKDVKERILEFIATSKLVGSVKGKILCFVGPPGVGKTSIGKSIARALNRNFFRLSVGGMHDVSEIKGHRRTYVGALPGRVIMALKRTGSMNPMILLDEIDKMGSSSVHGDPASAMLELLDPEQNSEFLDVYMDFPVDMSQALFVCTANTLETIPKPLLDRMEVIEIAGYSSEEKKHIATNYLIPVAKRESGLQEAKASIEEGTVDSIIKHYAKENGVRSLKKYIEKIYRKLAYEAVTSIEGKPDVTKTENVKPNIDHREPGSSTPAVKKDELVIEKTVIPETFSVNVGPENLTRYLGPEIFSNDRLYDETPPGVLMGLAYTSYGGTSLYVECQGEKSSKGGDLKVTGQLGDVMKESSAISFVNAKRFVKNNYFKEHNVYIHFPEGAVPKDGPSAGIVITSALISLALNKPLPPVAMTGEITLTGKVIKIGGLKQKLIAAQTNGIKKIYLSVENRNDFEDLEEDLKKDFNPVFVKNYSEIFDDLFGDWPNEPVPEAETKKVEAKQEA